MPRKLVSDLRQRGLFVLIGILAAVLAASPGEAQTFPDSAYTDVILLKNGGVIKGKITETIPEKKVIIERIDGNVLEVPFKKIDSITDLEHYRPRQEEILANVEKKPLISVVRPEILAGVMVSEGEVGFSGTMAYGLLFEKQRYLAIGVGWDEIDNYRFVPLFVRFRLNAMPSGCSPYMYADAGYAIGWRENMSGSDYGGFTFGVGGGVKLPLTDKVDITGRVGYRNQAVQDGDWDSSSLNMFTVMVGIIL